MTIHRIGSSKTWAPGLLGRALDFLAFYRAAFFKMRALAVDGATTVVKTDPPLLSVVAALALRSRDTKIIHWLQDVYPEVAAELGVTFARGRTGGLLARLRNWSLRVAGMNVTVGQRMQRHVAAQGVEPARICVIPNWIDETRVTPVAAGANPLRSEWGLDRHFVIGYSGNLGRAHEANTLLEAATRLKGRTDLCFLFIGGGFNLTRLKEEAQSRGVADLFQFRPYQSEARLSQSLSVPDVHWISLRPELEGLIVPSKFYGIAAVGRPVIAITDKDGEIAELVRAHRCGVHVQPGDIDALVSAIAAMTADPALARTWGANARAMLERDFSRGAALQRWFDVLRIGGERGERP
ncbi:glycosyltransferase involved in cell wall biosynthesis [Labrys monachus]|uniref:Glycosyltransferase involved in cell wall biosynthesis n=1 Tax=Labrys monachus TaxID=217067 RepID=A0ABU0F892_9HYPH|nr:glycosyltransferase involved in cell wall biosynthesis [Labrys monachus]